MAAADPLLGQRFGSIRLDAKLGAGAMGVVYRGTHEILKKEVAVKVLGPGANKTHARERFLREARSAAQVAHVNVVQVFEAGEHAGQTYLVMELVNGHSLGSILDEIARRAGKPAGMPPESVSRLGVGISLGLAAIHAQGIVHRDIKPDNIMVASDKTPKIADLGLAKQMTDPEVLRLTGTGMVVGTPLYVAPESIRNPETITTAADIYSLGATLYHMLTGVPPFNSATAYEVMRAHMEDRPRPIRDLAPQVPAGMAQLVEQCLEKDPRQRPSALALAELLGKGASLKAKANRGIILLVVATALAVGGGAGTAWWLLRPDPTAVVAQIPDGALIVQALHPQLRVRLGSGAWQAMRPEGLAVPPGKHQVQVEADQPGPAWRWSGEITIASAEMKVQRVDLQTQSVPATSLAMPGAGLLLLNGIPHSEDPSASVTQAGTWHLARWDDVRWRMRTYTVDHLGRATRPTDGESDRFTGDACWRRVDDSGQPCRPHHLVCWLMADTIRRKAKLPEPMHWSEQAARPFQPALRLNWPLVEGILKLLPGTALPDKALALEHHQKMRQPIWYRNDRGQPTLVGGVESATGSLVLVPEAEKSP